MGSSLLWLPSLLDVPLWSTGEPVSLDSLRCCFTMVDATWSTCKLGIKDTARVVPVHGVCGLWSLIAVAIFQIGTDADCNLHATFEGLCYCKLRLPPLSYVERLGAQLLAAVMMVGIGVIGSGLMYGFLYIIPIKPFIRVFERICCLNPSNQHRHPLRYFGGWLFTSPEEEFTIKDLENSYGSDQPEAGDNHTIQEDEKLIRELPAAVNVIPAGSHDRGHSISKRYSSEKRRRAANGRGAPERAHASGVPSGAGTQGDDLRDETTTGSSDTPTGAASDRLCMHCKK